MVCSSNVWELTMQAVCLSGKQQASEWQTVVNEPIYDGILYFILVISKHDQQQIEKV